MIEAETVISCDMYTVRKILVWCAEQFGPVAGSLDNVGENYAWGYRSGILKTSFHFAHARDCTLFILRWS